MDTVLYMLYGRDFKRLNFDTVIPYDQNDLLYICNPLLALRLSHIIDDNNNYLSIKPIMLQNKDTFACLDFKKRFLEFAEVMESKIERKFVTKRADFLFFDEVEQKFLKELIRKNSLSCTVTIYTRDNNREQFKETDIVSLPYREYAEIAKYLRKLKIYATMRVDTYRSIKTLANKSTEEFGSIRTRKKGEFVDAMMTKYPKLTNITSKEEFKLYARALLKKYHPDSKTGDHDIFESISADFDSLKETKWYMLLRDESQDKDEEEEKPDEPLTMISMSGGEIYRQTID